MSETKKAINTLDMEKVSAILLDVAGTTTAISFVKETLYPYIVKNAEEFLKGSWENEDIKKAIAQFEEKELDASKAAEVVKNLTEKDDSNVGLKTIQGLLLQKGYESGELKGHIFDDVLKFLESWSSTKTVAIFSSGSVESQKLLFKNSTEGDVTSHIKKFFDLSAGSKTDSESYKKIAKELEVSPVDVLFLTDDVKEAEAAKSAEINVVLVEREGNTALTEEAQANFTVIKSFTDISVEKMKRKIVEDSVEEPPKKLAKIEKDSPTEGNDANEKNLEENKQTEEKKNTENGDEAMEVDEEPIVAEKVAEEKAPTEDEKQSKPQETAPEEKRAESVEPKPEVSKEKPESMEVDSKEAETDDLKKKGTDKTEQKESSEEQTNKAETEMGTQTKCAVTNECETQTTISIAAVDDLPIKEVQDKLMATETKEGGTEEKLEKDDDNKAEAKETEEKKDSTVTSRETKTDVKEDSIEKKEEVVQAESKDTVESKKESENIEEVKEDVKEVKEDVKEAKEDAKEKEDVKEVKEDVKEVKEDVKEVKEDVKEVKEDVKEVKEDIKEVKEDVKEVKEDVKEVKENGNVCGKIEGESNLEKDEVVDAKAVKESTGEKKECLESNGAQEKNDTIHENGVSDGTVEKENKSQLANGKDSDVPNGETSEATNGTLEQNEDEIKVKKIGDNVESAPVSVEA